MATLGELIVSLGLNSTSFHTGIDKSRDAAKQFGSELKSSFGQLSNSFSQLGASIGSGFGPISGILNGVTQGFNTVGASIKAAGSNIPSLSLIGGAAAGIGGAAIAAAAGFAALSEAGNKVVEDLSRMHDKLGISIADLQVLKAVGDPVGVSGEMMARGFRTFEKALSDNTGHMSAAQIALKNLGVTAKDPKVAFEQVADAISQVEDPTVRMADATALFGRMGVQMLPALMRGKEGFEEARAAVERFGPVIGKDAVEAMRKNEKASEDLALAWDRVKVQSIAPFFASIKESAAEATLAITNFIAAGHIGGFSTYKPDTSADDKKAVDAKDALRAKQDAVNAGLERQAALLEAGGKAELALRDTENDIAKLKAMGEDTDWRAVIAKEAQLPALREAVKNEKEYWENLQKIINLTDEIGEKTDKMFGSAGQSSALFESQKATTKEQEEDLKKATAAAKEFAASLHGLSDAMAASGKASMEQGYTARESALRRQHDLGLISERQYQQGMKEIYQQELKDEQKLIQDKLAIAQAQAGGATVGGAGNTTAQNEALAQVINLQAQLNALTAQYDQKIQAVNTDLMKNPFTQFAKEAKNAGQVMQSSMVTALNNVAAGFAKTIVEGKNFGKEMREVAKQFAESFIEMELKRAMAHLMAELHMTSATVAGNTEREASDKATNSKSVIGDAKTAAANAYSAVSGIPIVGPILAPIAAATAFAGVMAFDSFEGGGIAGHTGLQRIHYNEMILPSKISEKVQKMADPDSGGGRGRRIHVEQHNTVHAIDGRGMSDVLTAQSGHLANLLTKELRRRNMI